MNARELFAGAAAMALLLSAAGAATAHECETLLTPYSESLTRGSGAPETSTRTVTLPTSAGQWWLTIESQGVTSAEVDVNGSSVFTPSDFKARVTLLRKPVTVAASTTIAVTLSGQPGEQMRVHLDGVVPDTAIPPALVHHVFERVFFTKAFTGSSSTSFSLSAAEGLFWLDAAPNRLSSGSVSLDGIGVYGPSDFSQQVTSLSAPVLVAAANTLAATITGPKSASLTLSLHGFMVDTQPPTLAFKEPIDGVWHRLVGDVPLVYSDAISGVATSTLAVAINGFAVTSTFSVGPSSATAPFSALYPPFREGENDLFASLQDNACNLATARVHALIDSRPPIIQVSPGDGSATSTHPGFTVTLSDPMPGSGVAPSTFKALLDGADVTPFFILNGTTGTARFTRLVPGKHTFLFTVQDVAGNQGQLTSHFTVVQPPVVSTIPADGSATNDTLPVIIITHMAGAGTTIDLSSVHLTLDNNMLSPVAQVASESAFLPSSPLAEGTHTMFVSVSDVLSDTTTATASFRVELTATHFTISIAPSDSASVLVNSVNDLTITARTASNLPATGFVGDIRITASDARATLDQLFATVTIADRGTVTIPHLAIVREPGPVTVTAVALASPSITGTTTLTGVTTVPGFLATPTLGGATSISIQTVPGATVSVLVDGQVVATVQANGAGQATASVSLAPGAHTLQVVATAPDGSSAGRSIIIVTGPPTTVSGLVLDGSGTTPAPFANVPVSIEGTPLGATTDPKGRFTITNVPVGTHVLDVNGSSLPGNFGLTRIGIVVSTPLVLAPIVMQPLDSGGTKIPFLDANGSVPHFTVGSNSIPLASLDVPAGTIFMPPSVNTKLTITQVSLADVPIQPPIGLGSSLAISLGPEGAVLPPGTKLTLPNGDGVPPGMTTPVWHYVPEQARWEIAGDAIASADGSTLVLDLPPNGYYAPQAPHTVQVPVSLEVLDENLNSVDSSMVLVEGTGLQTTTGIGPNNLLSFTFPAPPATVPLPVTIRVTRVFADGTIASVPFSFPSVPSGFPSIQVLVGHPVTIVGTVVAPDHNQNPENVPARSYPVRLADVFCNGRHAVTDYLGRFRLENVEVWNSEIFSTQPLFPVTASKVAGAVLTGSTPIQAPPPGSSLGPVVSVSVSIDGNFFTGGPQIQTKTVSSMTGTNSTLWPLSLIFDPVTQNFYTENAASFASILEIPPNGNTTWNTVASGLGTGGLQMNSMALAGPVPVNAGGTLQTRGERLWAVDGHQGTVYLLGIDHGVQVPGAPPAINNFGEVLTVADKLNPFWPGFAVFPLAAPFDGGGTFFGSSSLLVQFGNLWDTVNVVDGAHVLGTNGVEAQGITEDEFSVYSLGGSFGIFTLDSVFSPPPPIHVGELPALPTTPYVYPSPAFTVQGLTTLPIGAVFGSSSGPRFFAAIQADTTVSGFQRPVGTKVVLIPKPSPLGPRPQTESYVTVYSVPQGSNKHIFGIAWGIGDSNGPGLYVLQSDIQTAVSSGGTQLVTAELVKVTSVGGWANAFLPPVVDTDKDGLPDPLELAIGSNPNTAHSDGDPTGIDDYVKFVNFSINPNSQNFAGDGIPDKLKLALGLDYSSFVPVSIGIPNFQLVPNTTFTLSGTITAGGVSTTVIPVTLVSTNPAALSFVTATGTSASITYTGGPIQIVGSGTGSGFVFVFVNGVLQQQIPVVDNPDTTPPNLTLNIANNSMTCDVFPRITLNYSDPQPGSGVNVSTLSVSLISNTSGLTIPLIPVSIGLSAASYYPSAQLAKGSYVVNARIADNAGNVQTLAVTFQVVTVRGGTLLTTTPPEPENTPAMGAGDVYLSNGQVHMERLDLMVPGRGAMNFAFSRIYKSNVHSDGPLGQGWTHSYDVRVKRVSSTTICWLTGTGRQEDFVLQNNGVYASPTGFFVMLLGNDAGFEVRNPDGMKYFFLSLSDGTAPGCLSAIRDKNGNQLTFQYNNNSGPAFGRLASVKDPYDRVYNLVYDQTTGLLASVTDFTGRQVTYHYSAAGDLIKVTGPAITQTTTGQPLAPQNQFPNGRSEVYVYTSGNTDVRLNHKLLLVIAPNEAKAAEAADPTLLSFATLKGFARVENTWDLNGVSPTAGKLLFQRSGGTNATGVSAGGTFQLTYQPVTPAGVDPINDEVLKVTVIDRVGNQHEYGVNSAGQCVRHRVYTRGVRATSSLPDPAFFETQFRYNVDGLLLSAVLPLGNSIALVYDTASPSRYAQGNLIQRSTQADAARNAIYGGAVSSQRIVTIAYEPTYNQVRAVTDERGNDASYTPQNGGAASAARFRAERVFDYQQNTNTAATLAALSQETGLDATTVTALLQASGTVLGLGDQNLDPTDDARVSGDVVRSAAPQVTLTIPQSGATTQSIATLFRNNDHGQPTSVVDPELNVHTFAYYASTDPSGSGTPVPGTTQTDPSGGYLKTTILDSASDPNRDRGLNPTPTNVTTTRFYDPIGDVIGVLDRRGIRHQTDFNAVREVVRTLAATDTSQAYLPRDAKLPALNYEKLILHDANGNVIDRRVGNQGERTGDSTFSANAYWTTKTRFDILDEPIVVIREVTPILNDDSITETSPGVTVTRLAYDANQNAQLLTKPEGNQVFVTYDERDLRFTVTRGFGSLAPSTVQSFYDANGNLTVFVDAFKNNPFKNTSFANGDVTQTVFDGFDRAVRTIDAESDRTDTVYDPTNRVVRRVRYGPTEESSPRLAESTVLYDEAGRVFEALANVFTTPGTSTTSYAIPTISSPPPPGELFAVTKVELDRLGRSFHAIDPKGDDSFTVHDGSSRVTDTSGPLVGPSIAGTGTSVRNTVHYEYDGASELLLEEKRDVSPLTAVASQLLRTDLVWDAVGRVSRQTDSMNFTTRLYYDSRSNVIDRTDARSTLTVVDPLALRGPLATINGDGNATRTLYDGISRSIRTEHLMMLGGQGDGTPHFSAPDSGLDTTNPTIPSGIVVTRTDYDRNSRVLDRIDANSNMTTFGYDALDRRNGTVFADLSSESTKFDPDDNIIQTTDPNGSVIDRGYDGLNRLLSVSVPTQAKNLAGTGQNVLGTTLQAFEYDGLSRQRAAIDDNGAAGSLGVATRFAFDSISRLLSERHQINASVGLGAGATSGQTNNRLQVGTGQLDRTVASGYAPPTPTTSFGTATIMSVRTSVTYPGTKNSLLFGIDGLDRVQTVSINDPVTVAFFDFLGVNKIVQREAANGTSMGISYADPCDCPTTIKHDPGAVPFDQVDYQHDNDYNRVFARYSAQTGTPEDDYSYDSLNRCTNVNFNVVSGTPSSMTSYQLDGVHNFAKRVEGAVTTSYDSPGGIYAPDILNRFTEIDSTRTGTDKPVHDAAGSRIRQKDRHYFFDAFNRLVRVDRSFDGGATFVTVGVYTYDASGRRVTRTTFDSTGAQTAALAYVLDGSQEIEEVSLPTGSNTAVFVYGGHDVDELLLMQDAAGRVFYFHADAQQSTRVLTDANGNPVERYVYKSIYGVCQVTDANFNPIPTSSVGNPYRFQGRRFDPESGLYYFRNRFLDPDEGRFINRDPLGVWGDPSSRGNAYPFEGGNPRMWRDPYGLGPGYYGEGQAPGIFSLPYGGSNAEGRWVPVPGGGEMWQPTSPPPPPKKPDLPQPPTTTYDALKNKGTTLVDYDDVVKLALQALSRLPKKDETPKTTTAGPTTDKEKWAAMLVDAATDANKDAGIAVDPAAVAAEAKAIIDSVTENEKNGPNGCIALSTSVLTTLSIPGAVYTSGTVEGKSVVGTTTRTWMTVTTKYFRLRLVGTWYGPFRHQAVLVEPLAPSNHKYVLDPYLGSSSSFQTYSGWAGTGGTGPVEEGY